MWDDTRRSTDAGVVTALRACGPAAAQRVQRGVDLAMWPTPGETTHWTGRGNWPRFPRRAAFRLNMDSAAKSRPNPLHARRPAHAARRPDHRFLAGVGIPVYQDADLLLRDLNSLATEFPARQETLASAKEESEINRGAELVSPPKVYSSLLGTLIDFPMDGAPSEGCSTTTILAQLQSSQLPVRAQSTPSR